MTITKTPLRITLGGDGTDPPSSLEHFGRLIMSAEIDKYVYLWVNQTFTHDDKKTPRRSMTFIDYDISAISLSVVKEAVPTGEVRDSLAGLVTLRRIWPGKRVRPWL